MTTVPTAPPARERFAGALAAAAVALALVTAAPAIASDDNAPSTSYSSTSPYLDLDSNIGYGLTRDGRIRPCPGAIPNCVSTSSTTDLYSPALRAAGATTPEEAAAALDVAVRGIGGEKTFSSSQGGEGKNGGGSGSGSNSSKRNGIFLQYEVPGASPRVRGPRGQPTRDVVEVLLRREESRGKSSDETNNDDGDSVLVFYRSIADPSSIRYVPLIQQPVTDGGAQRARMRSLLVEGLGWRAIGCDVLDCFFE